MYAQRDAHYISYDILLLYYRPGLLATFDSSRGPAQDTAITYLALFLALSWWCLMMPNRDFTPAAIT